MTLHTQRFSFARLVIGLAMSAQLAACGSIVGGTITAANRLDQARDRSRTQGLVAQHLDDIRQLQAKGNPLGDYLWAEAHADKLVENPVQDPMALKALYETAAAKGSVDAKLVLAVKQFNNGHYSLINRKGIQISMDAANRDGRALHPDVIAAKKRLDEDPALEYTPLLSDLAEVPVKEAAWREGMKKLDEATQQRCFFYWTYIFAPQGRRCLAPRIAADEIWPAFRDGGSYPKDKALRDYWYDKAIACEATAAYQKALQNCPVFGASKFRVKD